MATRKPLSDFERAFAQARRNKQATFTWKNPRTGKTETYHTRTKDEEGGRPAKRAPAAKAEPAAAPARTGPRPGPTMEAAAARRPPPPRPGPSDEVLAARQRAFAGGAPSMLFDRTPETQAALRERERQRALRTPGSQAIQPIMPEAALMPMARLPVPAARTTQPTITQMAQMRRAQTPTRSDDAAAMRFAGPQAREAAPSGRRFTPTQEREAAEASMRGRVNREAAAKKRAAARKEDEDKKPASPRKSTRYNEDEAAMEFKRGGEVGLYANIHAKRQRIAEGSGEKMRKPGALGAPTAKAFRESAKTAKKR